MIAALFARWESLPSMAVGRADFAAVLVTTPSAEEGVAAAAAAVFGDARGSARALVIVCGGIGDGGAPLRSCEVLDLATLQWTSTASIGEGVVPPFAQARWGCRAAILHLPPTGLGRPRRAIELAMAEGALASAGDEVPVLAVS